MKTIELTGAALDWAVFTALRGAIASSWYIRDGCFMAEEGEVSWKYQPSTVWAQGGPIIERETMSLCRYANHTEPWFAEKRHFGRHHKAGRSYGEGPTLLIAAMRCYVASKLGDEVDVPEELK